MVGGSTVIAFLQSSGTPPDCKDFLNSLVTIAQEVNSVGSHKLPHSHAFFKYYTNLT